MITGDTIAAISTTIAPAARIIVRLSGPESHKICEAIFPVARSFGQLQISDLLVPATVQRFSNPKSYTGEDLIEFHIPGNPILAKMLLDEIIRRGARQAEAGEFTARAFFNGRIDLTEAEGVAATIAASNSAELNAARRLLAGELATRVRPIMDETAELLALVEAGIDFTEEDISFISQADLHARLEKLRKDVNKIMFESARFEQLNHEPTFALVGPPNAGKSTLLNALAGSERAVVSPVAGTTRDAISAEVKLRRGVVKIIDVAGFDAWSVIDESDPSPQAQIDRQMQQRAKQIAESVDFLIHVVPVTRAIALLGDRRPDLFVASKADLKPDFKATPYVNLVSAHTGLGMEKLRKDLNAFAFGSGEGPIGLALNARHVEMLNQGGYNIYLAIEANQKQVGGELIAQELRDAIDRLGQILGAVSPDDILGRIFSGFCIGK